ncbi:MAG TPA: co-chaperone GroES [Deltaproteobacteria bacterium]|nr:MAG: co-chaperone GroES [Deltaproteobacteria bacterium GWA2_45_12]HBF12513.1 co-chaperone GroES [Deltaproteobacteria bacterium]
MSKKLKVRPLHDRLIVKRLNEEEKTKGGIIIPDSAKEKPQEGEVLAVGNGKVLEDGKKVPLDIKVGDRILFSKYSGNEIKVDGEEYLILREDDVQAIVE